MTAVLALGLFGMAKVAQAQDCTLENCGGGGSVGGTCIEPPQSMTHWWTCDNLGDLNNYPFPSGTPALPLLAAGNASLTTGFVGNACTFNNSTRVTNTDSVNTAAVQIGDVYFVHDDPSLNPGMDSFTVEGWVNASTQASFGNVFLRFGYDANGGLVSYSLSQANGSWMANVGDGVTQVELVGPTVEPNSWHHLALVIQRNAQVFTNLEFQTSGSVAILYYDGLEATRTDISRLGSINPSGFDARMGDGFQGSVDEVTLYNTDLTPETISQIFTAQSMGKGKADSDQDGCSNCRDSACNVANLETRISYQGNYVANPIYAANAAFADVMRTNPTKLQVAVNEKLTVSEITQQPTLNSAVYHLLGKNAKIPVSNPRAEACNTCATAEGMTGDTSNMCHDLHMVDGVIPLSCRLCCPITIIGGPNCGTTQPFGLGCREMTRAEITAGGTCKDATTSAPFAECCPYPPSVNHQTVTAGQITPSISGNSIFVSDSQGCCIRTGGCKMDSSATDSSTDNFLHNYYYDSNQYCTQSPKPTGCP